MDDFSRVEELDASSQLVEDKAVVGVFEDLLSGLLEAYPMAL